MVAFVDHGREGSGEPVAGLLQPGNAGSNTASDHIEVTRQHRRGRRTLIRTDSAGGTHEFLNWLTRRGPWLSYSVGMVITDAIHQAVLLAPASTWTPAIGPGGDVRGGVRVAELAGDVLKGWPKGTRLIVRQERPHPGAQLRITDADGMRITCFATNTTDTPIAALPLALDSGRSHRVRATTSPSQPRLTSANDVSRRALLRPVQWNPAPARRDSRAPAVPTTSMRT